LSQWLSLLLIIISGLLGVLVGSYDAPSEFGLLAYGLGLYGGLLVTTARQPEAIVYEPRSFATRMLKWVTAPQIEAAILLWFGIALLTQPEQSSIFRLTEMSLSSFALGWMFLLLGWLMAVRLPDPMEYTLIAGIRLAYTALVALDVLLSGGPWIVMGGYVGGSLHGVLAMLTQWTLREVAQEVRILQHELEEVADATAL
jgi:hypothetical protein